MISKKRAHIVSSILVFAIVLTSIFVVDFKKADASLNFATIYAQRYAGFSYKGTSKNLFMGGKTACKVSMANNVVGKNKIRFKLSICEKSIGDDYSDQYITVKLKKKGSKYVGNFHYDSARASFSGKGTITLSGGVVKLKLGGEPGCPIFKTKTLKEDF